MADPYSAGASLIGGLASSYINYRSQQSANQTNIGIANRNNAFNERMWRLQNEYNTPSNQMARYRQAGLNTNLMYGNPNPGNSNNSVTAQPVSVQAPQVGNFGDMISNAQQLYNSTKMNDAQLAIAEAQRSELEAKARLTNNEADKLEKEKPFWQRNAENQSEFIKSQVTNLEQNTTNLQASLKVIQSDEKLKNELVKSQEFENIFLQKSMDDRLKTIQEQYKLTAEQVKNARLSGYALIKEMALKDAQINDITTRLGLFKQVTDQELKMGEVSLAKMQTEWQVYRNKNIKSFTLDDKNNVTDVELKTYGAVVQLVNDLFGNANGVIKAFTGGKK